jgi:hypothetical protein
MASAAPPGHTNSEYVIGFTLKCPQFECMFGQTYIHTVHTHISALYYIDYYIDNTSKTFFANCKGTHPTLLAFIKCFNVK